MSKHKIDMEAMIGKKFNRWELLRISGSNNGRIVGVFRCDCGEVRENRTSRVFSGYSKSCGCYARERASQHQLSHGASKTSLYNRWFNMRMRCEDKRHQSYHLYGGRGITVCDDWSAGFEGFQEWANDNGYLPKLQLDRIDNNSGYSPTNCRWVKQTENCRNKRNSKLWFVDGVEYDGLGDASEKLGLSRSAIKARCDGYRDRCGDHPPRENCWSELKYKHEGLEVVEL